MSVLNRTRDILGYLSDRGWMGEAGLGALVAAAVGVVLYLKGPGGAMWGVPLHVVYAVAAGVGVFLLAASLRLIPSRSEVGP
jgi:hypothetical protein